jgi:hypothetical protein
MKLDSVQNMEIGCNDKNVYSAKQMALNQLIF